MTAPDGPHSARLSRRLRAAAEADQDQAAPRSIPLAHGLVAVLVPRTPTPTPDQEDR